MKFSSNKKIKNSSNKLVLNLASNKSGKKPTLLSVSKIVIRSSPNLKKRT